MAKLDKSLHNAILLVHSEKYGIHWKFASSVTPDHTFLVASIGKTFTSVLIARLFEKGRIDYGYGLMRFHFKDLFFLLSNKYNMWGNSGPVGAYMYYVPALDAFLIGTFNQMKYERKHVVFLLKVLRNFSKI